ncbi:LysR family transcriptional regulator [Moritella viscosa]|uniref:LysR family transcriptional regulator n=1 Tax=Moritella viscosa TaxID=80854 RepID=UPI0009140CC3|nr:LysR family transcriptional regulator [Moritella viscosa]SGY91162.1 Transcriptional regulator [Moritella viscosa]SGY91169.1 Transcriptional regulator [Moritella viscosa]
MQSNSSLADIRAFVTIAEQGSFTKAAEVLQSSRAHVSRQLAQLEQQLGVQLIIRTTRAQRLTPVGEQFFQQCLGSLQTINQAVIAAKDDTEQLKGCICINCVGGVIGEDILTNIISEFNLQYPNIEVELDFSSPRVDLIAEAFDLVVRMGELEDSGLVARKLTDIKVQVLASPDYLAKHAVIAHPKDLEQHNCLTGSIKRWRFHQKSLQHNNAPIHEVEIHAKGNFSCKSGRALINAAKNGNGIVRLPELYCDTEIKENTLAPALISASHEEQWHSPNVPLFLLYHRNRYQPVRLKVLIDFIYHKFKTI